MEREGDSICIPGFLFHNSVRERVESPYLQAVPIYNSSSLYMKGAQSSSFNEFISYPGKVYVRPD